MSLGRSDRSTIGQRCLSIVVQHSPLRFAGVPLATLEPSHTLGQDTRAVLRDRLGWDEHRIAQMVGATQAKRK